MKKVELVLSLKDHPPHHTPTLLVLQTLSDWEVELLLFYKSRVGRKKQPFLFFKVKLKIFSPCIFLALFPPPYSTTVSLALFSETASNSSNLQYY